MLGVSMSTTSVLLLRRPHARDPAPDVVTAVPVVVLLTWVGCVLLQRYFVAGLTMGATKG